MPSIKYVVAVSLYAAGRSVQFNDSDKMFLTSLIHLASYLETAQSLIFDSLSTSSSEDEMLSPLHTFAPVKRSTSIISVSPIGPTRPGFSVAFPLCFSTILLLKLHNSIRVKRNEKLTATSGER